MSLPRVLTTRLTLQMLTTRMMTSHGISADYPDAPGIDTETQKRAGDPHVAAWNTYMNGERHLPAWPVDPWRTRCVTIVEPITQWLLVLASQTKSGSLWKSTLATGTAYVGGI